MVPQNMLRTYEMVVRKEKSDMRHRKTKAINSSNNLLLFSNIHSCFNQTSSLLNKPIVAQFFKGTTNSDTY